MTSLKRFQKQLRISQTDAESILWYNLRNRRLHGYKFRRQHQLKNYIVDFVCLEHKLIIELDGGQHADQKQYDEVRTRKLEEEGFFVLRFWNNDVLKNSAAVLETILFTLLNLAKNPHPARANSALAGLSQRERRSLHQNFSAGQGGNRSL